MVTTQEPNRPTLPNTRLLYRYNPATSTVKHKPTSTSLARKALRPAKAGLVSMTDAKNLIKPAYTHVMDVNKQV